MAQSTNARLSERALGIDASGIRRIFELGAKLENPCNLSIGQPDFEVPEAMRAAATRAVEDGRNGYTLTQGIPELRQRITTHLAGDLGWTEASPIVTSGTSGALALAFLAMLDPGDEVVFPDPYFVAYPHLATLCGATAVPCDTYPDLRMTAERVEPLLTERTKIVLFNSPSNPAGTVATVEECAALRDLCRQRGVLLITDEIYDEFTYEDGRLDTAPDGRRVCPSPARGSDAMDDVLLIRGFGKTYGVTGWRMGYASGPARVLDAMSRLQQYTYVCAPSMAQHGCMAAFDVDMDPYVDAYQARRDVVLERLTPLTEVPVPHGAFYAFVKVPEHLGLTGTQFVERCIEHSVLVIPGSAFSSRDTHFRISYATDMRALERGIDIIAGLMAR